MTLKKYLKTLSQAEQEDFAERCDTSVAYLKKIAGGFGGAKAGESMAIKIERESGGKVRCETSCPGTDWKYIRGTSAA